jgi:hypothetical protein
MLLLLAVALILLDAIVTKIGLDKGFTERNLILRWFLAKFGPAGLLVTRIVALGLLLLLFNLLDQREWLPFSITFSSVMVYVLLTGIKKTR